MRTGARESRRAAPASNGSPHWNGVSGFGTNVYSERAIASAWPAATRTVVVDTESLAIGHRQVVRDAGDSPRQISTTGWNEWLVSQTSSHSICSAKNEAMIALNMDLQQM